MTLSPGEVVETMAASTAPVPEELSTATGCSVTNTLRSFAWTESMTGGKSALRWCTVGRAPASRTSGGTSTGPGVNM